MAESTILEDFPRSKKEFDRRFRDEETCYEYLCSMRWPEGSGVLLVAMMNTGRAAEAYNKLESLG